MNISELTDVEVMDSVQATGSIATEVGLTYGFSLNETFFIYVRAGLSCSIPEEILKNLDEYKKVTIELYHYKEPPPIEETHMDPIVFTSKEPDGTTKTYRFEFDVQVFPHIKINPKHEEPFKNQPWADSFEQTRGINFVSNSAVLPWRDVCDIIRYCDKISRLKLFW